MSNYTYKANSVDEAIKNGLRDLNLTEDKVKIEVLESGSSGFFGLFKKEALVKLVPLDSDYKKEVVLRTQPKVSAVPAERADKINKEKENSTKEEISVEETEKEVSTQENLVENNEVKAEVTESATSEQIQVVKEKKEDPILKHKEEILVYIEKIVHSMGFKTAKLEFIEEASKIYTIRITDVENSSLLIGKRGNTLNSLQYLANNFGKKFTNHYFRINIDCDNYRENRRETLEELALNMAKKSKETGKPVELEPMTSEERKIIHGALSGIKNVETLSQGKEPHRYLIITAW